MKEIKNIKNKVVKLGGPGSGPNPGDTRGSYNTKGKQGKTPKDRETKDNKPTPKELHKPLGGEDEELLKELQKKDDVIEKKARDIVSGKAEPDMSTQEGRLAAARASRIKDENTVLPYNNRDSSEDNLGNATAPVDKLKNATTPVDKLGNATNMKSSKEAAAIWKAGFKRMRRNTK